jgi:hypothetical protein
MMSLRADSNLNALKDTYEHCSCFLARLDKYRHLMTYSPGATLAGHRGSFYRDGRIPEQVLRLREHPVPLLRQVVLGPAAPSGSHELVESARRRLVYPSRDSHAVDDTISRRNVSTARDHGHPAVTTSSRESPIFRKTSAICPGRQ